MNFDLNKITPENIELILEELKEVAVVEDNKVIYDDTDEEQCQKLREIFDKYLLD